MLIASIVLLAFIGFLHMTRGTAVRHVHGVGADGSAVAPGEPQFPTSVAMLTGAALGPGNRVELALNGDGTLPRLWEDLRSARQSITLQVYYGQGGTIADTLRQILVDRAAAGVRVFVLYDVPDCHGTHPRKGWTAGDVQDSPGKATTHRCGKSGSGVTEIPHLTQVLADAGFDLPEISGFQLVGYSARSVLYT